MNRNDTDPPDHPQGQHRRNTEKNRPDYPRADAVAAGESDHRDDSGVGITNTPMGDHRNPPRSRYTGHGRDTEGAFGEEDVPPDRP
jgi:hypothetical protein